MKKKEDTGLNSLLFFEFIAMRFITFFYCLKPLLCSYIKTSKHVRKNSARFNGNHSGP